MTPIPESILNHHDIEHRLPHAGKMSLLNEITHFDQHSLKALAISHLDTDNPLRIEGKIAMVNGIEYAAQAMAIHGSLLSEHATKQSEPASLSSSPQSGYIATVRNIDIQIPFIPETDSPLIIEVEQLMSDSNGFTYQFHISCEQQSLISGRITVFLIHTDSENS